MGHIGELLAVTDLADSDCSELLAASESLRKVATSLQPRQSELSERVTRLGKAFTDVVDYLLAQQIKVGGAREV